MELTDFLKLLGEKIRTIRKTKKISQERLAELSGLHPTYISDIERGKVNASVYSFFMIAKALDIPFSELVNIPSGKTNIEIENELTSLLSLIRTSNKKKQVIFLSAIKGLISGLDKI